MRDSTKTEGKLGFRREMKVGVRRGKVEIFLMEQCLSITPNICSKRWGQRGLGHAEIRKYGYHKKSETSGKGNDTIRAAPQWQGVLFVCSTIESNEWTKKYRGMTRRPQNHSRSHAHVAYNIACSEA